jgi:uncharacterized membrane protein
VIAAALNFVLPGAFTLGPPWLVAVIELAIVVPLTIVAPRRVMNETRPNQTAAVVLIAVANVANVASLILLIHALIYNSKSINGVQLLYSSVDIWATNVLVFSLWYWELDRGGPDERLKPEHRAPDFLFPQMVTPDCTEPSWSPKFFDYVYVAFTNATAFSPTDTMPLTQWAKFLMLGQAATSLATIAIVASRAVNILG